MFRNFDNVIININSKKNNNLIFKNFPINGLFKIKNKSIIDWNLEWFENESLNVYILVEKKYAKILEKNLVNKNFTLLIKETFNDNSILISSNQKILIIDDDYYFNGDTLNYFLKSSKLSKGNFLIKFDFVFFTDYISIINKDLLKHYNFVNNLISAKIESEKSIIYLEEDTNLIDKVFSFEKLVNLDSNYISDDNILYFTPGPVYVSDEVKGVLKRSVNHHRSLSISYIYQKTVENIKWAFNSKNGFPIALLSTGTAALESCFINLFNPQDKILIIENGYFGKSLVNISKRYNLDVTTLDVESGKTFDLQEVETLVKNKKALFVVHMDTSFGILNPVQKIGEICKKHNVLLIVDAISTVLNENFNFDEWNIDVSVCTSAKGFEASPGLSFLCISPKAMQISIENKNFKPIYLDWNSYILRHLSNGLTPGTFPVNIFSAINANAENIKENGGIENLINNKKRLSLYLTNNLKNFGFKFFIDDEKNRSNWVNVMVAPECIKASELRAYLYVVHSILIELGIQDEKGALIRLGISGAHHLNHVIRLVDAIKNYLELIKD